MSPSSHTQPLSPDWKTWPRLRNRKPRRGLDPLCRMSYRRDDSKEQFLIDGADEHHDTICTAIAAALLSIATDPNIRLGRFSYPKGPTRTPTIRVEYLEDRWTVFTADIWTSTNMDSMLIVVEHWSYLSGSWFGRHLIKHAEENTLLLLMNGLFARLGNIVAGALPWVGVGYLLCLGVDLFVAPLIRPISVATAWIFWGPVTLVLGAFMPFSRRLESAPATEQVQRQFVDRVRQCIYTALADLGVPASAIHHSDG